MATVTTVVASAPPSVTRATAVGENGLTGSTAGGSSIASIALILR